MITYRTIYASTTGLYRERGSKFIAAVHQIADRSDVEELLRQSRKSHPKARHHCFAYRLGHHGDDFRSSDDGEPSGTAGKPILNQIDALSLTHVLVVVVRYFGGKLLGAAGLIRAYREAAHLALAAAEIMEVKVTADYTIECPFEHVGRLEETLAKLGIEISSRTFDGIAKFLVKLPLGEESIIINRALATALGLPKEQVGEAQEYAGIRWRAME